jgi:hypothetical protein
MQGKIEELTGQKEAESRASQQPIHAAFSDGANRAKP